MLMSKVIITLAASASLFGTNPAQSHTDALTVNNPNTQERVYVIQGPNLNANEINSMLENYLNSMGKNLAQYHVSQIEVKQPVQKVTNPTVKEKRPVHVTVPAAVHKLAREAVQNQAYQQPIHTVTETPVQAQKQPVQAALKPVEQQPLTQKPVAPQPVAQKPVVRQPIVQKPVVQQPVAQKPVAPQPVAQKPVAPQPVAQKPVAQLPVAQKPVAQQPVVQKPVAQQPVVQKPVAQQPVAQQPAQVNPPQKTQTAGTLSAYEQQVFDLTNQERAKYGLPALKVDPTLSKMAREKSQDMSVNNYFSHTSPTYGSPFDMMKKFGITYNSAGENIAMGQKTPQEVVTAWMNSPGHRQNILDPNYTYIGVGYVAQGNYWTQDFIGK